ncbi:hypothetical protein Tsubulata_044830 [Turnera subulata]|uniref:Glycosyltransferase n=1 Tax=Turnera subulata TaxID=218843 RepID=A0A9Q0F0E0_9ROSI|nr:hypothetical protein Tsubulata_044830 [Turnera subulata]
MASAPEEPIHFVLIPLLSPSHLIPMIDMARLLARHGVAVSIVTTPLNAIKFAAAIERDNTTNSGRLNIQLLQLQFPALQSGLPRHCENMAQLPSRDLIANFFQATAMLQQPFEELLDTLQPPPSCIVSGKNLPWTVHTARKYGIPRIFFDAMGCFASTCAHKLEVSQVHANLSKFEPFLVPDLPHTIELTRAKLPENLSPPSQDLVEVRDKIRAVEAIADGIVVNSFQELETEYVQEYRKVKGDNVWCVGPVSACNKLDLDIAERGEKSSVDVKRCLEWLDLWEPGSVVYACLGSICGLATWQLVEVGLGLEASNRPFVWVIKEGRQDSQGMTMERWIEEEGFEERTKGRGLLIRGWAPQVLILSHPAAGGFLTHCGWNSTMEGVTSGVPILACPLFAEQFFNEKLVVEVLGIGVSVGVEAAVAWGMEEKSGLVIKREQVRNAVVKIMDKEGTEAEERRRRAKELGDMAKRAIEEGGSSHHNMDLLIQFVRHAQIKRCV